MTGTEMEGNGLLYYLFLVCTDLYVIVLSVCYGMFFFHLNPSDVIVS